MLVLGRIGSPRAKLKLGHFKVVKFDLQCRVAQQVGEPIGGLAVDGAGGAMVAESGVLFHDVMKLGVEKAEARRPLGAVDTGMG